MKQEVLGRTNRILPFDTMTRQTIFLLLYVVVFVTTVTFITKMLPSNDKGIHIQTHRLMGGIYEVRF
jgi:hypothetical protein